MQIDSIKRYSFNYSSPTQLVPQIKNVSINKHFTSNKIKPSFFQKLKAFFFKNLSLQQQVYIKQVKTNITNKLPQTQQMKVNTRQDALAIFLYNKSFDKKVKVTNPKDGSTEIFSRTFDPVTHENCIIADYYNLKGKLHHTTVYDEDGLKLSQYFVKINESQDPISIRQKYFNADGKIIKEEIKYKNGDITYADYDYTNNTQTFKNVSKDGSYNIVKSTQYSSEIIYFNKNGEKINYNLLDYKNNKNTTSL